MKKILLQMIFICGMGCAPKSVEPPLQPLSPEEVKKSIAKLVVENFEFRIKFEKPDIRGNFKGIHLSDLSYRGSKVLNLEGVSPLPLKGRVKIEGFWEFNGNKEELKAIGIGEKEYRWEDGQWKSTPRTKETDPISTLQLVCSMQGYKFKTVDCESFVYEFTPNLLFMDPRLFGAPAHGVLWINTKSMLPEKVIAEDENIRWEFLVKNMIEEEYCILSPLAKTQEIEVIVPVGATRRVAPTNKVAQILKQRFELYGFDEVKYELKENRIVLEFLSESLSPVMIQSLTQPGRLELYRASYPTGAEYELTFPDTERVRKGAHFVCGDPTNPVFLKEKIEVAGKPANFVSEGSKSYIELTFDKDLPEDQLIAVVVDEEVIGIVPETWGKNLKIEGDRETWIKIKLPLPCPVSLRGAE